MSFVRVYIVASQSLACRARRMSDVLCEAVLGVGSLQNNAGRSIHGPHNVKD